MFLLLLLTFITTSHAQTCTTADCSLACNEFQTIITRCNYDYYPSDNFVSCICKYGGLQNNLQTLAQCVVCNQDGLASNPLSTFQIDYVICDEYFSYGESQALSYNSMQPADLVALFSSEGLPGLQSTICGGGSGSVTMSASVPAVSTSSFVPGSSQSTPATTTSASENVVTSQTTTSAQRAPLKLLEDQSAWSTRSATW